MLPLTDSSGRLRSRPSCHTPAFTSKIRILYSQSLPLGAGTLVAMYLFDRAFVLPHLLLTLSRPPLRLRPMNSSAAMLEIQTLGHFSMFVAGKAVASAWPGETHKLLFCSLLSPLDLSFSWDRICRSVWGVPLTLTNRLHFDEVLIQPLNKFLIMEFGFTPVITNPEGLMLDLQRIYVDAHEFYFTALEGLRMTHLDNHDVAMEKLKRAKLLYTGSYLPGLPGKIIENTRHDLDLYHAAVVDNIC